MCHNQRNNIIREKYGAQWASRAHRQDLHLWLPAVKWQKATSSKFCWSRCKLTGLQCSTGAWCRKCGHTTALPRPQPPPTTTPAPFQPPALVSQDAPPPTLLFSLTPTPLQLYFLYHTTHWTPFVVLHLTASTTSMSIQFTVNRLKMQAVVRR